MRREDAMDRDGGTTSGPRLGGGRREEGGGAGGRAPRMHRLYQRAAGEGRGQGARADRPSGAGGACRRRPPVQHCRLCKPCDSAGAADGSSDCTFQRTREDGP